MESCQKFFCAKSIQVQYEWLKACIEWIIEENSNITPNPTQLTELVYEQWLMADLHEIAVPTLPSTIPTQSYITIDGNFNLQVQSIVDIGHSAYSQLMKVKGQEIDILDDRDEDDLLKDFFSNGSLEKKKSDLTPKWKEKSARMLFLQLSDGYQSIGAIEYQHIQHISVDTIMPGGKVLVLGPVNVCDGLILLKPENIKVLGGNVEQLVEDASQIKVLNCILEIDSTNEPRLPHIQQPLNRSIVHQQEQLDHVYCQNKMSGSQSKSSLRNSENLIEDDMLNDDIFENVIMDDWDTSILIDTKLSEDLCGMSRVQENNKARNGHNKYPIDNHSTINKKKKNSLGNGNINKSDSLSCSNYTSKSNFNKCPKDLTISLDIDDKFFEEDIDIDNIEVNLQDKQNSRANNATTIHKQLSNCSSKDITCNILDTSASSISSEYRSKIVENDSLKHVISEPELNDIFAVNNHDNRENHTPTLRQEFIRESSLPEMITVNPPLDDTFLIKGWFKTLRSRLQFENHYKLLAVLTDGVHFVQVLLADKALNKLIGYTSKQVSDAVGNRLTILQKDAIKLLNIYASGQNNMPAPCTICGKNAVLKRPKTGDKLCKDCFYRIFEEEINHTIVSNELFTPGDTVAIGASGGKDSTVLAYIMKTLNERFKYGLNLILLSIDEGITGYRDDSLETVKRNKVQYDMPLKILSYEELYGWTMDDIVRHVGRKNNCTFCGVFRRQALDRGALMVGANKIVTGHNADDVAETVLMNILRGDIARLQRCTSITTGSEGATPRCKPFKYTYEKEIVMYAYFKKLDYFSTECIYSPNAYRGYARAFLKDLEAIRPSSIIDIIYSGECMSVKKDVKMPTQGVCTKCGYISSQALCKACVMLEGLNRGLPKLGIGRVQGNKGKAIIDSIIQETLSSQSSLASLSSSSTSMNSKSYASKTVEPCGEDCVNCKCNVVTKDMQNISIDF